MVDHFARAAQAFGLTISLKKTEVSLHQNSPLAVYSPPQITINGHLLTYLSSVISNDAMITKDLDHLLAKASSSFGHLQHRMWQSHPLRLMTKVRVTWQLSSALFCMLWNLGAVPKAYTAAETLPPVVTASIMGIQWQDYVTNDEVLERARLPNIEAMLLHHAGPAMSRA